MVIFIFPEPAPVYQVSYSTVGSGVEPQSADTPPAPPPRLTPPACQDQATQEEGHFYRQLYLDNISKYSWVGPA